jgi:hypothetical protein
VVPGELLAGAYPGHGDCATARARISALFSAGVRTFVDLTEECEVTWTGEPLSAYAAIAAELAIEEGIEVQCRRHGIADYSVPTSAVMRRILDEIDASIEAHRPVYVHCWGGIGRTGVVVGCFLSRHGIARGPAVIETISDLRRDDPLAFRTSPESREQRDMVVSWGDR